MFSKEKSGTILMTPRRRRCRRWVKFLGPFLKTVKDIHFKLVIVGHYHNDDLYTSIYNCQYFNPFQKDRLPCHWYLHCYATFSTFLIKVSFSITVKDINRDSNLRHNCIAMQSNMPPQINLDHTLHGTWP